MLQFLLNGSQDPIDVAENSVAYPGTHDNETALG